MLCGITIVALVRLSKRMKRCTDEGGNEGREERMDVWVDGGMDVEDEWETWIDTLMSEYLNKWMT